ncbi:AAA family ATPase [Kribbella sp.]|uniref:AAA family ATPase n=1 Tax=Kribbella sp. TaxID=1871183 RepID=UPI002D5999A8|nr:hypothetical protein [Kribbella sp.]HZX08344.1 hypothetical protein [Kribbella sp.]
MLINTITDMHPTTPRALLFNGTVGAGKTSVAAAAGESLARDQISHAVIDLDALAQIWPAPIGDPFNLSVTLANLHAVAANYLAAKAEWLLVSGVVETRSDRERYRQALGVPLQVCRLRASGPELSRRLRARHTDEPDAMAWHLDRAGELDRILDTAAVDDFEVLSTGKKVRDIAAEALEAARAILV